ncbi:GntR family transcriptional regulator [Aquabacter sp. CN5-332]|uniref:GntR family transcriptional regulator n=1 Tax=Aquabacter sp. CN5-332 TaxID=3156608 RepID=UPI0032B4548A
MKSALGDSLRSETTMQKLRMGPKAEAAKPNLVELAYEAIKRAVLENAYPPGYQAGEVEIARQLDMSRTPVHEAMARLQEEGLVRILPRRGILVRGLSPDDIDEIYDVIIALEGAAGERLARLPEIDRERIAGKLEGFTAEMSAALVKGDRLAWAQADKSFHACLADDCGNERLDRIVGTVTDQLHRARMFTLNLRPLPTLSALEHQALTDAIRAGDADRANQAARRHRQHARDQLVPLLRQLNLSNL